MKNLQQNLKLGLLALLSMVMFNFAKCGVDSAEAPVPYSYDFDLPASDAAITKEFSQSATNQAATVLASLKIDANKVTSIALKEAKVEVIDNSGLKAGDLENFELYVQNELWATASPASGDASQTLSLTLKKTEAKDLLSQNTITVKTKVKTRNATPAAKVRVTVKGVLTYEF